MATAERQGNRRREGELYWSAQTHGRIISVNGHEFFAPTDLMRLVSEYRSPRKVCERTGLSSHRWQSWERKYANTQPWALGYVLRVQQKSVPKGQIVRQVSQQKSRKRTPRNHVCYTTAEQEAFRRNASNEAAIEHAKLDLAAGLKPQAAA